MSVFTMDPDLAEKIVEHVDNRDLLSLPWRDYTRTEGRAVFVNPKAGITITLTHLEQWLRPRAGEPRWTAWRHDPTSPTMEASWPDTMQGETSWDLWAAIERLSAPTPCSQTADTL